MRKSLTGILWVLLPVAFALNSCKQDQLCTPAFNLDLFEQNVIAELDGQVMGYSYAISRGGNLKRSGADGKARNGNDGNRAMSIYEVMQVASISKSITTVTVLAVMEALQLDPETTFIGPYFPSSWARGPGISTVTIFDLLHQCAGLNNFGTQSFNATRMDSLQLYVSQGATQPKTRTYSNTHHALFRVILPMLLNFNPGASGYTEQFFADSYKDIVDAFLLSKLNFNADCLPPANSPALAYSSATDQDGSGGSTDFSLVSGGTGWNLSTFEIAKYWAFVWFSDELIDSDARDLMEDEELGLWNSTNGKYGRYKCKLGGWGFNNQPDQFDSCAMHFPDGTQVVLICNSPRANGKSLRDIARDAYDASYGC